MEIGDLMYEILIVEDNIEINNLIYEIMLDNNYQAFQAFNAFDAMKIFQNNNIDLIVTDLMLPIKSGEDFIKDIRLFSNVYIVIISAKVDLENRLEGLTIGADDYIVKPFSGEELVLKINNHFKRKTLKETIVSFNHGNFIFEFNNNVISINNKKIELTSVEYLLLEALINNKNQILSRQQLLDKAFSNDRDVFDRVVDVHIKNIRSKIKKTNNSFEYIKTIYGLGYMFVGDTDD